MNKLSLTNKVAAYSTMGLTYLALAKPMFAGDTDSSTFQPSNLEGVVSSGSGGQVEFSDQFGFTTLSQAINTIISVVFFGAALAAFVFIVLGAFQYVTAGDDAGKTEKSRKTITNAVVGLILVALVYVIFQIAIRIVPGLNSWFGLAG